jgi:hypothetical protein
LKIAAGGRLASWSIEEGIITTIQQAEVHDDSWMLRRREWHIHR